MRVYARYDAEARFAALKMPRNCFTRLNAATLRVAALLLMPDTLTLIFAKIRRDAVDACRYNGARDMRHDTRHIVFDAARR